MRCQRRFLAAFLMIPVSAYAANCSSYPYTQGINIENAGSGVKIIATGVASVSFNDVASINDAREEATLKAKALIAQFLNEGIKSKDTIKRAVNETSTMQGNKKILLRKETIIRVENLSDKSAALLRGVVPIGECYSQGQQFRVSVGIKPKSIADAASLARDIGNSNDSAATPSGIQQKPMPPKGSNLNGESSFSYTKGLNKF